MIMPGSNVTGRSTPEHLTALGVPPRNLLDPQPSYLVHHSQLSAASGFNAVPRRPPSSAEQPPGDPPQPRSTGASLPPGYPGAPVRPPVKSPPTKAPPVKASPLIVRMGVFNAGQRPPQPQLVRRVFELHDIHEPVIPPSAVFHYLAICKHWPPRPPQTGR